MHTLVLTDHVVAIMSGDDVIQLVLAENKPPDEILETFLEFFHYPDNMLRAGEHVHVLYRDGNECTLVVYDSDWKRVQIYRNLPILDK